MIPRYSLPEMASIWEPNNKFKIWLKVEVLACEALAKRGEIPKSALKDIQEKSDFKVERIDEIEKEVTSLIDHNFFEFFFMWNN